MQDILSMQDNIPGHGCSAKPGRALRHRAPAGRPNRRHLPPHRAAHPHRSSPYLRPVARPHPRGLQDAPSAAHLRHPQRLVPPHPPRTGRRHAGLPRQGQGTPGEADGRQRGRANPWPRCSRARTGWTPTCRDEGSYPTKTRRKRKRCASLRQSARRVGRR